MGAFCGRVVRGRLARRYGQEPVPLPRLVAWRRLLWGRNPFSPTVNEVRDSSASLDSHELAALLRGAELGTWSMHPQSLNAIGGAIRKRKPGLVIELGSGWSTVCLAFYMQKIWGSHPHLRVVAIEQDSSFAAQTRHLLETAGLGHLVEVREVPVEIQQGASGYMEGALGDALVGLEAQMFVIDGPAGAPGIRRGTLPRLAQLACHPKGALFFLDDALRDGELAAGQEWASLPDVAVRGVSLTGTGLLVGELLPPKDEMGS